MRPHTLENTQVAIHGCTSELLANGVNVVDFRSRHSWKTTGELTVQAFDGTELVIAPKGSSAQLCANGLNGHGNGPRQLTSQLCPVSGQCTKFRITAKGQSLFIQPFTDGSHVVVRVRRITGNTIDQLCFPRGGGAEWDSRGSKEGAGPFVIDFIAVTFQKVRQAPRRIRHEGTELLCRRIRLVTKQGPRDGRRPGRLVNSFKAKGTENRLFLFFRENAFRNVVGIDQ